MGGGVYKQRVARPGGGKSGGFRTIILFKVGAHCFFAHGFAKNEKGNVTAKELKALKRLAEIYLEYTADEIGAAVSGGELIEVLDNGNENKSEV